MCQYCKGPFFVTWQHLLKASEIYIYIDIDTYALLTFQKVWRGKGTENRRKN